MKWLLRTAVALGLLACLGYASYAFGMYVLSKKLFGDTVMQNSASETVSRSATVTKSVTRKSRDKNAQASAEVNVLDARDAGPGPQAPSLDALERETRARDYDAPRAKSRQRIITAESLKNITPKNTTSKNDASVSAGTNSDENRPRRRRRRRRRSTTTSATARNDNTTTSASSSSDASTRDTSSSSRDSSGSSSSERPSRRREKRIESPVPGGGSKSSSGSSGSESPVPVPE